MLIWYHGELNHHILTLNFPLLKHPTYQMCPGELRQK